MIEGITITYLKIHSVIHGRQKSARPIQKLHEIRSSAQQFQQGSIFWNLQWTNHKPFCGPKEIPSVESAPEWKGTSGHSPAAKSLRKKRHQFSGGVSGNMAFLSKAGKLAEDCFWQIDVEIPCNQLIHSIASTINQLLYEIDSWQNRMTKLLYCCTMSEVLYCYTKCCTVKLSVISQPYACILLNVHQSQICFTMCVCIYMYTHTYIYTYMCIHIHVHIHIHIEIYTHTIHIHNHTYIYICIYIVETRNAQIYYIHFFLAGSSPRWKEYMVRICAFIHIQIL